MVKSLIVETLLNYLNKTNKNKLVNKAHHYFFEVKLPFPFCPKM